MSTTLCKPSEEAEAVRYRRPVYSVEENKSEYVVAIRVPGCTKDDIQIDFDKDVLSVRTNRSTQDSNRKSLHREFSESNYELKLNLNVRIDSDKVNAKTEDGILRVTLPVAEEAKAKQIAVN
jgi:HSP20 family protein